MWKSTVSDNGGSKGFDGASAKALKDTCAEDGVIGSGISTPDVGTEEEGKGYDERGSLSEDEREGNPDEVA